MQHPQNYPQTKLTSKKYIERSNYTLSRWHRVGFKRRRVVNTAGFLINSLTQDACDEWSRASLSDCGRTMLIVHLSILIACIERCYYLVGIFLYQNFDIKIKNISKRF